MSFAAHLSVDCNRPVNAERMLRSVVRNGRGQRTWRADGAAIGFGDGCSFATGPAERAALFDGQLHNRRDLVALCGGGATLEFDNARLLLAVHERCGEETADAVIGDYAFAIWDGVRRQALLAVDPGGMRTLVVHDIGGELLISNEAAGLYASGLVERKLDEVRVAEWLSLLTPEAPDRTFYDGIRRVPPGGRGIWTNGRLTIERWWRPETAPIQTLPNHAAYTEAVRAALDEAVACRLDPDAKIGSHLSGGLDSSTVTALAAHRLEEEGRRLTAFTAVPAHVFTEPPGRFGNEWPHAAAVAARYSNIEHLPASNADTALIDMLDLRETAQDVPLFNISNSVWNNSIERQARDRGITVMLTAQAGNMTFSYDGATLVKQLMQRGHVLRAMREIMAIRRVQNSSWTTTGGHLAAAILSPSWNDRLRALFGRYVEEPSHYSLIDPRFASRHGVAERMRDILTKDSRAIRLEVLQRSDVQGEFANCTRRLYGIDTRDPTMDRRVVELCLAIPDDQYLHRGQSRAIARSMGTRLLPQSVHEEQRRGLQGADWLHGAVEDAPRLKADVASLRAGRSSPEWIDLDRIDRMLDRLMNGEGADVVEWTAITRALAAGRFVRRVEGSNQ